MTNFFSSHLLHFIIMGTGIAMIMGLLTPTQRFERTKKSIIKYWFGLIGIGLLLGWLMYFFPRNPIRF
ncbi:MAG: hypothetical protein ACO25G_02260 [Holophagaceae bacterium]|jgi:drug/metabolite transporter (DMT)-like permease|nr:hypothetical protein [Acidobacteriota bacterium]